MLFTVLSIKKRLLLSYYYIYRRSSDLLNYFAKLFSTSWDGFGEEKTPLQYLGLFRQIEINNLRFLNGPFADFFQFKQKFLLALYLVKI